MTFQEFLEYAKELVKQYTLEHMDETDKEAKERFKESDSDVYVVWCCKTLQNAKALISTNNTDGMYYEVTYNGNKDDIYFDAYKKFENRCYHVYEKEKN